MRLHPETALVVVCLCLWIPVAQSQFGAFESDDQDGSGDDEEFSGSGSGDGIWLIDSEVTIHARPNTTTPTWHTEAPVKLPEYSVTQFVIRDTEPETSGHITEAPLQYTTQISETRPSPVIIISLGSEQDQEGETTTISDVMQPDTTVTPVKELPVVPTHEEEYTTSANDEDTKESLVINQEENETTVLDNVGAVTTEAPHMEMTTLPQTTTTPSNLADTEASGDVESTTVRAVFDDFIEKNIIPVQHEPSFAKPTMSGSDDFEFDNEIKKPGVRSGLESDFALGSTSDNDSLLERKEVLAGVIAGGVVGLAFAIMLVALMVYRMKKKDEGSYSLDEHKHPNGGYKKPQKQEEFLA